MVTQSQTPTSNTLTRPLVRKKALLVQLCISYVMIVLNCCRLQMWMSWLIYHALLRRGGLAARGETNTNMGPRSSNKKQELHQQVRAARSKGPAAAFGAVACQTLLAARPHAEAQLRLQAPSNMRYSFTCNLG
jgi:hypothetical protein